MFVRNPQAPVGYHHKCQCDTGCDKWVKDPNRGFSRGHKQKTDANRALARNRQGRINKEIWASYSNEERAVRLKAHSKGLKGRTITMEARAKQSLALTGRPHSKEHVAKQAAALSGRKRPESMLLKLRATKNTPECVAKASLNCKAQLGKQSKPEMLLEERLDSTKFVYTGLNRDFSYEQPISADFVAKGIRLLIQVDGCFFHYCPLHSKPSIAMEKKHAKDKRLTLLAESKGWTVLRFWEHEIKEDIESVILKIEQTYQTFKL